MSIEIQATSRNFDQYFTELKQQAQAKFGSWTKFSESNVGTLMLELMAMIGDQNSFYLNRAVNEAFLPTVKQRRNAQKILKRMDYALGGRTPASVDLTFTLEDGAHTQNVTIPEGYQVKTADGVYVFETVEEGVIEAGDTSVVVAAKHFESITDYFTMDGSASQEYTLSEEKYIEGTMSLAIDTIEWTEQDDLIDSDATDTHYKVDVDDDLYPIIVFGDGINGAKPTGEGVATYKYGGGAEANAIQPATITKMTDNITDALDTTVSVTVTNIESPSGGEDEESVDEARKKAPRARKVVTITVSRDQYEAHSEEVEGVARVLALCKKDNGTIPDNRTYLYVVPEGGGNPSSDLKDAVRDYLTNEKPIVMSTFIDVLNPVYKEIAIAGTVEKKDMFQAADVKAAVDAALTEYFSFDNIDENNAYTIDFGFYKDKVYVSEITSVILNTKINGVFCVKPNITITLPTGQYVSVAQNEIPSLIDLSGLTIV